jgi:Rrf2 family protein
VQVSARVDYALRAMTELAAAPREGTSMALRGVQIAASQRIPKKFMENILFDLRRAGLIKARRGVGGGYQLAHSAHDTTLADIIRAVEGPLANVRGEWPEDVQYSGSAALLQSVWIAVRANLRAVLEAVTLDDLVRGKLPEKVADLTRDEAAWRHH